MLLRHYTMGDADPFAACLVTVILHFVSLVLQMSLPPP